MAGTLRLSIVIVRQEQGRGEHQHAGAKNGHRSSRTAETARRDSKNRSRGDTLHAGTGVPMRRAGIMRLFRHNSVSAQNISENAGASGASIQTWSGDAVGVQIVRHSMKPFCLLAALLVSLALAMPALHAQAAGNRLILKNGSYQTITKYEVIGNRVRYFSAERDDWEEVPKSMVNWKATAEWELAHRDSTAPVVVTNPNDPGQVEAAKIDAAEREAREAARNQRPVVAPGLRLPNESGVWALDTFNGQPELARIAQAAGNRNEDSEHSVKPYRIHSKRGSDEAIRANGFWARVSLHVSKPVFYISLTQPPNAPQPPSLSPAFTVNTHGLDREMTDKGAVSSPKSDYVILALHTGKDMRWASALQLDAILAHAVGPDVTYTKKEILPGGYWMKITPDNNLLIGQYALIEILAKGVANLDVWDFGIKPQAPDNVNVVAAGNQ